MKQFIAAILLMPLVSLGAVQATRQYCDNNREKAVSNAVSQLEVIAGPTIESYMKKHGMPSVVTNTTHEEKVIQTKVIDTYHTNYVDNVISNFYTVRNFTNNYTQVTNIYNYVDTVISNKVVYQTNTIWNVVTNTTVERTEIPYLGETNTHFIVSNTGTLSIEQNDKVIWNEKDSLTSKDTINMVDARVSSLLSTTLNDHLTWQSYLDGSNVVFRISDYLTGAYSCDDAKLRILELKEGDSDYTEVYNSRDEISKHLIKFSETNNSDKAWGQYTSSGQKLSDLGISNTVYMTSKHTVFAGDTEWQRVAVGEGAIFVLVNTGTRTYTTGDEGTFKFQDDGGTNYFGFAKTDSYTVGANTDGISVSDQMVTLTWNITSSVCPIIYYTTDLGTKPISWVQLNNADGTSYPDAPVVVQWEQNPPEGQMQCYINVGTKPAGFFKAEIVHTGGASFITNMPADLQGGIMCSDGLHKVKIDYNNGNPKLVMVE